MRHRKSFAVLIVGASLGLGGLAATSVGRAWLWSAYTRLRGRATVEERLAELRAPAERMRERCGAAGLPFPPRELTLVAFKNTRRLRVLGRSDQEWRFVAEYPILAASGKAGPKLNAGDGQVPEGIYPIESLHPNSRFHLALRVGYPNAFDREQAAQDGRPDLGGDIMIHGGDASEGCLAIGDAAIEEVFVLVASTGIGATRLILTPSASVTSDAAPPSAPSWLPQLYESLAKELARLPLGG